MRLLKLSTLFLAAFALTCSNASAQVIFSSELDSDAGWSTVGDDDTSHEFGFDYTKLGIPKNPNNASESTTGLRLAANIVEPGAAAAIAAYPDGQSFSGSYQLKADFWLNFNTSGGTTEYIGGFIGHSGAKAIDGIGILGDSDGDSPADYRFYSDGTQVGSRGNDEADIEAAFPGQPKPEAQEGNNNATAPNGTLGFGWHTLTIDVNSATNMVDLSINDFHFSTIDATEDPSALEGNVALGFADLFNSVASNPEFAFGVFDNVSVSQVPEPNGLWLAGLGVLGLAAIRRRR